MDIIYDISVRELIESEDESLHLLIQDINILLKNPEDIKNNMNWELDNKLLDWDNIKVENRRIVNIEFSTFGIDIKDEDIKRLILPHDLKRLCFTVSKIGYDGIKGLVEIIPSELEELWFYKCKNIDIECLKVLKLPLKLKRLFFTNSNINEEHIKELCKILPPGLKELYLESNNIGDEGAKGLILPPGLQTLFLNNNNIGAEGAKGLVLPPGLQELYIEEYNEDDLLQQSKTPEGIKRYSPIQRYYDFKKCKPIWKEICRGLIYGETEDPIFITLQKIQGVKNIRENILTYYNPFLKY